ncbi:MAG TPA: xanthine dehydrogenase family protein subunit M [Thermoleophilaceae bacterium]|nr:xanthine dehydrogenase family protein subunit M [Thermoleophilaceae bacterium]
MKLSPFELHRPGSLAEAGELLERLGDEAAVYCGGTELLLVAKLGLTDFTSLVDVKGIPELRGVSANGELRIGAAVTHRELERSETVRSSWPALAGMERDVGNVRVRNTGTIGGNLCFADPHSDPATFLLAAGAEVALRRGAGPERRLAIEEFVRGPYDTALEPAELLVSVHVPRLPAGTPLVHRKISFRERPAITVAVRLDISDGGVAAARIAVGSVAARPLRPAGAEDLLRGSELGSLGDDELRAAGDVAAEAVEPMEDLNGSAEYKRQLVRVVTTRALRDAVGEATR